MTVEIGNSNAKISIRDSDNEYVWYINGYARGVKKVNPIVELLTANDNSQAKTMFILDHLWEFETSIDNETDWFNLMRAVFYWDANNSLLTLTVKNEWDSNLAVYSDVETPTILKDETGQLRNLMWQVLPQSIKVRVQFRHLKEVTQ